RPVDDAFRRCRGRADGGGDELQGVAAGLCAGPFGGGEHVCAEYASCDDPRDYAAFILRRPDDGCATGFLYADGDGAGVGTGFGAASASIELGVHSGAGEGGDGAGCVAGEDEREPEELAVGAASVSDGGRQEGAGKDASGVDLGR